jgi:hypothetical protein
MKKTILALTSLYFSLTACEPKKEIKLNSYQSNEVRIPLLLDPLEEERSFAKMKLIDMDNKDTIDLQTDNWGRIYENLDTTKTYFAFVEPGYNPNGNPGDQFKSYKTKKFIPNKNLTILKKGSELEKLAKK